MTNFKAINYALKKFYVRAFFEAKYLRKDIIYSPFSKVPLVKFLILKQFALLQEESFS